MAEETDCRGIEFVGILRCEAVQLAASGDVLQHIAMIGEVIAQTLRHVLSLRDDADALRGVLAYLVHQQWLVSARKDEGVNLRVFFQYLIDALLYKIVSAGGVKLEVLHQRHPHGAVLPRDSDVGVEFLYLYVV